MLAVDSPVFARSLIPQNASVVLWQRALLSGSSNYTKLDPSCSWLLFALSLVVMQPAWGIRLILEALISFFPTHSGGAIGGLDWAAEERK